MQATVVSRLAGSLVALLAAAELPAQSTGSLTGKITAPDGNPIASARIAVPGTALEAVAALDGAFRIHGVPSRSQTLRVRMLGYQPRLLTVEIVAGETLHVDVILTPHPLPLDTVEVSSHVAVSPGMRGFAERRQRGPGVFFTRDEIQRMQPRVLTDVLRRVPGLQVRPIRGGMGNNVSVQARGSECPMMFFMNGSTFPLPGDQPIDHFVAPEEVIAVEVYAGSSEIPAQFNSSRFNSRCGVIVIWTRYGPERNRRP
jgi:hypothetical protein